MSNRLAGEAVQRIGVLYVIETELRGKLPDARVQGREQARTLLDDVHAWLIDSPPSQERPFNHPQQSTGIPAPSGNSRVIPT